jgi:hypothetical protein
VGIDSQVDPAFALLLHRHDSHCTHRVRTSPGAAT